VGPTYPNGVLSQDIVLYVCMIGHREQLQVCCLTHKSARTGRYASEEENGEDMCQISTICSFCGSATLAVTRGRVSLLDTFRVLRRLHPWQFVRLLPYRRWRDPPTPRHPRPGPRRLSRQRDPLVELAAPATTPSPRLPRPPPRPTTTLIHIGRCSTRLTGLGLAVREILGEVGFLELMQRGANSGVLHLETR